MRRVERTCPYWCVGDLGAVSRHSLGEHRSAPLEFTLPRGWMRAHRTQQVWPGLIQIQAGIPLPVGGEDVAQEFMRRLLVDVRGALSAVSAARQVSSVR